MNYLLRSQVSKQRLVKTYSLPGHMQVKVAELSEYLKYHGLVILFLLIYVLLKIKEKRRPCTVINILRCITF